VEGGRQDQRYFTCSLIKSTRSRRCWEDAYGQPNVIRCDNGPEYISGAVNHWAQQRGIRIDYIQPGKPQQNAYMERYNCTVRYDWLSQT
jgi:putative transposase